MNVSDASWGRRLSLAPLVLSLSMVVLLSVLLAALWVGPAQAQPESVRAHLTWDHPVNSMCPNGNVLQSDVEQLMGQRVFVPEDRADVLLRGSVEDLPTGVHARFDARDPDGVLLGTREMTALAGDCASLRRPLALVLTMLLDREDAQVAQPRAQKRTLQAGIAAVLWSGTLPRIRPGLSLSLAGQPSERLRLRGHGTYVLPITAETSRGVGAHFHAFNLGMSACPRLSGASGRLGLWLCAGAQLAGVSASPRKLDGPSRQLRLLGQAVVELALSLRIAKKSALELACGLVISPSRPAFSYVARDDIARFVYRPALVGAIFRLGVTIDGW